MWAISLRAGPRIPWRLIDTIHTTLSCDVWQGKTYNTKDTVLMNYKETITN